MSGGEASFQFSARNRFPQIGRARSERWILSCNPICVHWRSRGLGQALSAEDSKSVSCVTGNHACGGNKVGDGIPSCSLSAETRPKHNINITGRLLVCWAARLLDYSTTQLLLISL
jgi:hypothetical protein